MARDYSTKRRREMSRGRPLPLSVFGYCPYLTKKSKHHLKTATGETTVSSGVKHNHILCVCPTCDRDGQFWYRCVISDRFLRYKDIEAGESLDDQPIAPGRPVPK